MRNFMIYIIVLAVIADACSMEAEPKHEHDWMLGFITITSTCSTRGQFSYICRLDTSHVQYDEMAIDPYNHVVTEWEVTKKATCANWGSREGVCTLCSVDVEEGINKLSHQGTPTTTFPPSCALPGRSTMTCTACGERVSSTISALGHNWKLTNPGRYCLRCGFISLL